MNNRGEHWHYKGYWLLPNERARRFKFSVYAGKGYTYPLYRAESLEAATEWVDGYRDGVTWAVLAKLPDPPSFRS
jgi:hypothetical protein